MGGWARMLPRYCCFVSALPLRPVPTRVAGCEVGTTPLHVLQAALRGSGNNISIGDSNASSRNNSDGGSGSSNGQSVALPCSKLENIASSGCREHGVGDFVFAANASAMRLVFAGALKDLFNKRYTPGACPKLHGVLAARIAQVAQQHGLRLGRYSYEGLDYTFLRSPLWNPLTSSWLYTRDDDDDRASPLVRKHATLWQRAEGGSSHSDRDVGQPLLQSACASEGLRYCGCPHAPPRQRGRHADSNHYNDYPCSYDLVWKG